MIFLSKKEIDRMSLAQRAFRLGLLQGHVLGCPPMMLASILVRNYWLGAVMLIGFTVSFYLWWKIFDFAKDIRALKS